MMLDAALSGRPLRRNTYLFARLAADGTLNRPYKAWELLLHLIQTQVPRDARLILGSGMEEELNALLVIQKAGFFVDYEVISAPTFEAARELFYEDGKPAEAIATAIAGYQEVREKAFLSNSLNTFLSLTAVESRLVKARDASPLHLSAAMLATQAVRRPAYFTKFMMAQELDRRLQPLATFRYEEDKTTSREVRDLYKTSRESIQPLEKLAERNELLLLKEALDLIQELNSIARSTDDTFTTRAAMEGFNESFSAFRDKLRAHYQTD